MISVNAWLSKVEIFQEQSMFIDYRELGTGLRYLLACPRLQRVVIDTGRGFWQILDDESRDRGRGAYKEAWARAEGTHGRMWV